TIEYKAVTTEKTIFNPMNHVYFNLNRDNNVIDNHSISSSTLKMHLLDNDHFVTTQKPLNLEHVFARNHIQFNNIFNSEHHDRHSQVTRYGGPDNAFQRGQQGMTVESIHFQVTVETNLLNVVIFTFNDTTDWESDFNIY